MKCLRTAGLGLIALLFLGGFSQGCLCSKAPAVAEGGGSPSGLTLVKITQDIPLEAETRPRAGTLIRLEARVEDEAGAPVAGRGVLFHVLEGGGWVSANRTPSDSQGIVAVWFRLGPLPNGRNRVATRIEGQDNTNVEWGISSSGGRPHDSSTFISVDTPISSPVSFANVGPPRNASLLIVDSTNGSILTEIHAEIIRSIPSKEGTVFSNGWFSGFDLDTSTGNMGLIAEMGTTTAVAIANVSTGKIDIIMEDDVGVNSILWSESGRYLAVSSPNSTSIWDNKSGVFIQSSWLSSEAMVWEGTELRLTRSSGECVKIDAFHDSISACE